VISQNTKMVSDTRLPRLSSGIWPTRYALLDGWRGLAALMVVADHAFGLHWGHWAVLFFFVISGYCISASANSCRQKGLGTLAFIKRRLRRIYPPYFFALLFFLATRVVKSLLSHESALPALSVVQYVQNFTLTQWVTLLFHPSHVAFINPTLFVVSFWTLNYEEQFYLLMAFALLLGSIYPRFKIIHLVAFLGVVTVLWVALFGGFCYGLFIDYWPIFALGSLVYFRLTKLHSMVVRRVVDGALAVLIVALSVFTYRHPCDTNAVLLSGEGRAVFTELLLAAAFGFLLIQTRTLNDWIHRSKIGAGLHFLGKISYSLYLVNQFNLMLVASIAAVVLPAAAPLFLKVPLVLGLHILIATIFWYFCERPFLNEPIIDQPPQAAPKLEPEPVTS
jgi:peptidoglycan/LPS O-acetylase OafA/YrhL